MTSIATTYRFSTYCIYSLLAITGVSILAYLFLTVATIFATSHRSFAVRSSSALVSQIGELEQSYLTLQNRVNPNQAIALGLVQPKDIHVVSLGAENLSLSN